MDSARHSRFVMAVLSARMAFIRTRIIKGKPYTYLEERWREGKKVRSRSTLIRKRVAPTYGHPTNMFIAAALPVMIAYELVRGNKLQHVREHFNPTALKMSNAEKAALQKAAHAQALYGRFGMYVDPKWNGREIEKGTPREEKQFMPKAAKDDPREDLMRAYVRDEASKMERSMRSPDEVAHRQGVMDAARAGDASNDKGQPDDGEE